MALAATCGGVLFFEGVNGLFVSGAALELQLGVAFSALSAAVAIGPVLFYALFTSVLFVALIRRADKIAYN